MQFCHWLWCQRETGATFALNTMIEAKQVSVVQGAVKIIDTSICKWIWPAHCTVPNLSYCRLQGLLQCGPSIRFGRVGTRDQPQLLPPDIHIFISTWQPLAVIPWDMPAVAACHDRKQCWPEGGLERYGALRPEIEEYASSRRIRA